VVGTSASGTFGLLTPLEQELLRLVDLGRNVGAAPLVRVVRHENETVRLFDIIYFRALADPEDLSCLPSRHLIFEATLPEVFRPAEDRIEEVLAEVWGRDWCWVESAQEAWAVAGVAVMCDLVS